MSEVTSEVFGIVNGVRAICFAIRLGYRLLDLLH